MFPVKDARTHLIKQGRPSAPDGGPLLPAPAPQQATGRRIAHPRATARAAASGDHAGLCKGAMRQHGAGHCWERKGRDHRNLATPSEGMRATQVSTRINEGTGGLLEDFLRMPLSCLASTARMLHHRPTVPPRAPAAQPTRRTLPAWIP